MALDTLSIPAMSAELERVFSQVKRFYTDDRNRLLAESFEALQCMKQWSTQEVFNIVGSAQNNLDPANQGPLYA